MLTVWGRRNSSNVQAVMWCIGELDLPHQRHDAGFTYGVTNTQEFLAMNPNGTIPVLQDRDGEPIWETGAILRYLGARYGTDPFWPRDPGLRAQVDKWAEWAKLNVAQAFTRQVFWPLVVRPRKTATWPASRRPSSNSAPCSSSPSGRSPATAFLRAPS